MIFYVYIKKLKNLWHTGFFHIFISSTLSKAVSLLSGVIIARILTKSDYGIFSYAFNIYSFVYLCSGLGLATAMLQVASETDDKERRTNIYAFCARLGLLINVGLGIAITIIAGIAPLKITAAKRILIMFVLLPVVEYIFEIKQMHLRTEQKNKQFASINLIYTIALLAFSTFLCLGFQIVGRVASLYLSLLFVIILLVFFYHDRIPIQRPILSCHDKRDLMKIGLVSMMNNGLAKLMYLLDVFVLGIILADEKIIASYKIATIIPTALSFIPTAVITYVYPSFAKNRKNKKWLFSKYRVLLASIASFNALIAGICFLLAPWIISLIFGKQYLDAVTPFRILCVSYFFTGTFRVISGNLLLTQRKLLYNTFTSVFSSLMNTGLNIVMISKWQSNGAALATLITVLTTSVINTCLLMYSFSHAGGNDVEGKNR